MPRRMIEPNEHDKARDIIHVFLMFFFFGIITLVLALVVIIVHTKQIHELEVQVEMLSSKVDY